MCKTEMGRMKQYFGSQSFSGNSYQHQVSPKMGTTDMNGPNALAKFSVFSMPPLDARDMSKCRSASAGSCV